MKFLIQICIFFLSVIFYNLPDIYFCQIDMSIEKLQLLKQRMKKKKKQQVFVGSNSDAISSKQIILSHLPQEIQNKDKPFDGSPEKQQHKQQQKQIEDIGPQVHPPSHSVFKPLMPLPIILQKPEKIDSKEFSQILNQHQPKLSFFQVSSQQQHHSEISNSQQKNSPVLLQNLSEELKSSQKQKSGENLSVEIIKGNNLSENPSIVTENQNRISVDEQPLNVQKQKLIKLARYLLKDVDKIKETVANIEGSLKGLEYIKNKIKVDKLFAKKIKHKMNILKNIAQL